MREIDTPVGKARIELAEPAGTARALLILGHGAGGGVDAPDLVAARDAALAADVAVARITQPYRVAGRRSPAPAHQLDTAWVAVVGSLTAGAPWAGVPLVVGGRSSGARVACRTAATVGACGVLCLAFPVHAPGRPEKTRLPELETGLPTLAVSGDRDPFGTPPAAPGREVVIVPGAGHDLRRDRAAIGAAVARWLTQILAVT